jgi:hypothetical protein
MIKRLVLRLTSLAVATMLVSGAIVVPTAAAAQAFNVEIPVVNEVVENPCNGEIVTMNGVIHELLNTVDTPTVEIFADASNSKNLTGSGSYGNSYRIVLTDIDAAESQAINDQGTFTELGTFDVISEGSAPNFRVTLLFHLTVANGEVTSDVEISSETCTG